MRRGSVTLELAFVVPVVFVLLAGFIEWGWLMAREVELIHVVRDGAHLASRNRDEPDPAGVAEARTREALLDLGFPVDELWVACTFVDLAPGRAVRLRVSLPYAPLVGVVPVPQRLAAETTMLLERAP